MQHIVRQMWEKILGVKVELDFNEWGTFQSKTNNGEFQIAMMTCLSTMMIQWL